MITPVGKDNCLPFLPMLPQGAADTLERPETLAFGVVKGDAACGAVLAAIHPQGAELTGLYVAKGCRREGQATALLGEVLETARRLGVDALQAISHSRFDDLNAFLAAKGFEEVSRSGIYTVPLAALLTSKTLSAAPADAGLVPLADLPDISLRRFNQLLDNDGAQPLGPIDKAAVDTEISMAYAPGGQVGACAWFSHRGGVLSMDGLYQGTDDKALLLTLLRRCLKAIGAKYPPETQLQFTALNNLVERLLQLLLKGLDYTRDDLIRYRLDMPAG